MICFQIGMNHIYSMIILALYGLAGLIRDTTIAGRVSVWNTGLNIFKNKLSLILFEWMHIIKKKESRRQKFQSSMQVYRETALYLKEHKMLIFHVIFITFIQRLALFAATYFVYLAFGLSGTGIWEIIFLSI